MRILLLFVKWCGELLFPVIKGTSPFRVDSIEVLSDHPTKSERQ